MGEQLDNLDNEEQEEVSKQEKKSSLGFSLFDFNNILSEILRIVVYLVIFSLIYYFFFNTSAQNPTINAINQFDAQNQTLGEISIVGSEIVLEEMLINTSDSLENHFVKARIVISYGSQETGNAINVRLNQIYDRIRKTVGSKSFNEIKYVDGQELLSLEIKTEIQKVTGKVDIYNIFFKDFTVY